LERSETCGRENAVGAETFEPEMRFICLAKAIAELAAIFGRRATALSFAIVCSD